MLVKWWFAYACFTFQLFWKNLGWVTEGGASEFSKKCLAYVPPVDNPCGVWRLHLNIRAYDSATLISALSIRMYYYSLCNKHYAWYFVICRYMCDLTSWAHIWCVFGFVLKTGCYNAHLHRQIYHCGIPLGGLPMIFCRQLVRQVGGVHADPFQTRWISTSTTRPQWWPHASNRSYGLPLGRSMNTARSSHHLISRSFTTITC